MDSNWPLPVPRSISVSRYATIPPSYAYLHMHLPLQLPIPVCLNHAASADFSFSSGECFSDFCCSEKGPHWTRLLWISSWSFTTVFSMDRVSSKMQIQHVPYVHQLTLNFYLPLTVNGFHLPLLFIFHSLCGGKKLTTRGTRPHYQWKSHWTVTIPGKTRRVLLHHDGSKHCTCPLNKCI
jgi:hypothetical protein